MYRTMCDGCRVGVVGCSLGHLRPHYLDRIAKFFKVFGIDSRNQISCILRQISRGQFTLASIFSLWDF